LKGVFPWCTGLPKRHVEAVSDSSCDYLRCGSDRDPRYTFFIFCSSINRA
jgi:hypothetical protein